MALGAGFKLNNKDNSRSKHSLLPQDADESIHRKSGENVARREGPPGSSPVSNASASRAWGPSGSGRGGEAKRAEGELTEVLVE